MSAEKRAEPAAPPGNSAIQRAAAANTGFVNLSSEAKAATDKERSMTLLQGIKLYPKAVGWSMLLSTCLVMEGYDLVLLSRFVFSNCSCIVSPEDSLCLPPSLSLCTSADFLIVSTPSPSS